MENSSSKQKKCYYCKNDISLEELYEVDIQLKNMDEEDREFLYDCFPDINTARTIDFVHKSEFAYDILNICMKCLKAAMKKIESK